MELGTVCSERVESGIGIKSGERETAEVKEIIELPVSGGDCSVVAVGMTLAEEGSSTSVLIVGPTFFEG